MKKREENARKKTLLSYFDGAPDELVFWSFRYFLGRRTIATCCFAEDLAKAWPYLNERCASMIRRELDEEFAKDDRARSEGLGYKTLGDDCDRDAWEKVRKAYSK